MTRTSTDQERAEFHEWKLRDNPKYKQTDDSMQDRRDWLVWQAARRALVVQSVAGVEGGVIRGEPTFAKPPAPPAAPQPPEGLKRENPTSKPEAAPVQMPEAEAWRYTTTQRRSYAYRGRRKDFDKEYQMLKPEPLYTEQQVRQLLADHGIK